MFGYADNFAMCYNCLVVFVLFVFFQDVMSGLKTFRFSEVHGKSEITAMAFDTGFRRLVTGSRGKKLNCGYTLMYTIISSDGTVFIWNFHNGQLIRELVKHDSSEVSGILVNSPKIL
jgi:WD40 repeat protein